MKLKRNSCSIMSLAEVSLTKSDLLLDKITNIDIKDTRFCCFVGTNSMSAETSGLQRRLRNAVPHSM